MSAEIYKLIDIMARLRDPDGGCAWDLEQDFGSIAPYTVEEAYEVADAIERGDLDGLKDELGDLLLQVVFHARMAEERGLFDMAAVARAICDKMIRRHPHVFAVGMGTGDPDRVRLRWEEIKAAEKADRAGGAAAPARLLEDVARALPALMRAEKLQKRAARVGFDWPDANAVMDKIDEELNEVRMALADDDDTALAEEIGDLLFTVTNLARRKGIDPEHALRATNLKFERRFAAIEDGLRASGRSLEDAGLDEMEALWQAAKRAEYGQKE